MASVPVQAFEPAAVRALARFRGGRLEFLKWAAFALMLVDHYAAYVAGVHAPVAEFLGALVLPTFAFAFAVGCAPLTAERREGVWWRVLAWACVAQLAASLVRDALPLNVLFVFGAALAFDLAMERGREVWARLAWVGIGAALGYYAEFAYPGVGICLGLLRFARYGNALWLYVVALGLLLVAIPNQSMGALFAPPFVAALLRTRIEFGRAPRVFYAAYAGQFVVMAALAAWLF